MRCSARRSRAAATISIARVIFWTFLTEAIREGRGDRDEGEGGEDEETEETEEKEEAATTA